MIDKPGFYFDVSSADYLADPCPDASATQSILKTLIERSPLHAWCEHPRLNPDYIADEETKFDIGNAAHAFLIGRGKKIVRAEFDDWRTKAAKAARLEYEAVGQIAVLAEQYDRAADMADAARRQLSQTEHADAFVSGAGFGEAVIAWQEDGFWCRSMLDWLMPDKLRVYDFKTTKLSCAPHEMAERPSTQGWDIQGAWHERGLDVLDPKFAGRRRHLFVAQEEQPPYAMSIVQLSADDLTMGRKKIEYGLTKWKICMARKSWRGYPPATIMSQPRGFTETKWLNREIHEAAQERHGDRDARNLMAG